MTDLELFGSWNLSICVPIALWLIIGLIIYLIYHFALYQNLFGFSSWVVFLVSDFIVESKLMEWHVSWKGWKLAFIYPKIKFSCDRWQHYWVYTLLVPIRHGEHVVLPYILPSWEGRQECCCSVPSSYSLFSASLIGNQASISSSSSSY